MNSKIVKTNENYTYNKMKRDITALKAKYPFLQIENIGESVNKRQIPAIRIGTGPNEVMYSASIHANEWITSLILMKFVEDFCMAYVENKDVFEHSARKIFESSSIFIVPMLNPDGVSLITGDIKEGTEEFNHYKKIAESFYEIPFPNGWKANYNGVDLNLQFPAGWQKAKEIKYSLGFNRPAPRDFVGYGPLTEPESLSIYNYTLSHNFRLILSYHTQGEVIYWNYESYNPSEAEEIGKIFSKVSGYSLEVTPEGAANAGYKDWFIKEYNRPGYTIEAGKGTNPLPLFQFKEIYRDNIGILVLGALV